MNVLHPTTTFPQHDDDHWGPFLLQLCGAIQRAGAEVEVVASNTPDTRPMDTDFEITRFDYFLGKRFQTLMTPPGLLPNIKTRPWRAVQLPFFYWALGHQIRRRAEKADIVHAHWLIPTGFAAVRNADTPVVASSLGAEYYLRPNGVLARLVRYTHEHADRIVTLTEHQQQKGIERFDCPPEKIDIIPNAANTDIFRPDADRSFREEQGIGPEEVVITTVQRLIPGKNTDNFIRATAPLVEERDDVRVLIIGDGPERGRLEDIAAGTGNREQYTFTGYVAHERLPAALAESDLFVLASSQEGMSTVLLEAMATETPCIASRAVGNDEIIDDEKNGILYEQNNVEELSESLERLLSRPAERDRLGEAARKRVVETFSYHVVADQYIDLYQELLEET